MPERALSGAARTPAPRSALSDLDEYAKKHGGRARGIFLDLESGETLGELDAKVPVNPASTQKLITAGATLELLGPGYTFTTELRADLSKDSEAPAVTLVGGGAPDLETADLLLLVHALRARGLQRLGAITVDQSRFDGRFVPPAFEEQPSEWAAFRAPVSALALAKNTITLHVLPRSSGESAKVWFDPPGLAEVQGQVKTLEPKEGDRVIWELTPKDDGTTLLSRVSGGLGAGQGHRSYERRLDNPLLSPGLALRALLTEAGISVDKEVSLRSTRSGGPEAELVTRLRSEPLSVLVRELGKDSDNFTAEMLTIALSQTDGQGDDVPWSTERGTLRMKKWLIDSGIDASRLTLRNGSGLFGANLVSAEALARVLEKMAARSFAAPEYLSQLSIAGSDGTLRKRFVSGPLSQRIRAKTGTLADTIALGGYVLREDGRLPIVFVTIVSGVRGRHTEVRSRIDRAVASLLPIAEAARRGPRDHQVPEPSSPAAEPKPL